MVYQCELTHCELKM